MRTSKGISIALVFLFVGAAMMVFAQEGIKQSPSCKHCGMDREKFGHTGMYIKYDDGTMAGTCSLHCAAVELAVTLDKTPKTLWVADYSSKKLIDAEKAAWVIVGNKPDVMTKQSKWAFENKADAGKFMKENGGRLSSFDEAIKLAYENMYQDTKIIREKRKMMKEKAHTMEHGHQM